MKIAACLLGAACALVLAAGDAGSANAAGLLGPPSVFLQCDGSPAHRSGAELAGRILLIMATAGIAGTGEHADIGARLSGAEGAAACDAAIARETDPVRKVQLALARAIHHVEAKDYDAALADVRGAPALAGPEADTLGFRHSLELSVLELEAAVQVRLGHPAEAEDAALRMAAAAPYDLVNQERTARYTALTTGMAPLKKDYFDRFARMYPKALIWSANAETWAGDYRAAEADIAAYIDLETAFILDKTDYKGEPALNAERATLFALMGDIKRSNELAAIARVEADNLEKSGEALSVQGVVNGAQDALDFQRVVVTFAAGNAAQARQLFTARSRWRTMPAALVADVILRLRKGAPAGEVTGPLADDPAALRNAALAENLAALTVSKTADADLYAAIRAPLTPYSFNNWDDDVWNTAASPFLKPKTGKETLAGDFLFVPHGYGIAVGDALLMHAALLAKTQGKAGVVFFPARKRLDAAQVRFVDPGEPGAPPRAVLDATTVITALSSEFPDPKTSKPARAASPSADATKP